MALYKTHCATPAAISIVPLPQVRLLSNFMRIGFVSTNNQCAWGGSEELWSQTAINLLDKGHSVCASVRYWNPQPQNIHIASERGLKLYYHLSTNGFLLRAANKTLRLISGNISLSIAPDYHKMIRRFHPDLVVVSMGDLRQGLDAMCACHAEKLDYVTVIQLVSSFHSFDDDIADRLSFLFANSRRNYFVSRTNIMHAELLLASPIMNSTVVRNPLKANVVCNLDYPNSSQRYSIACVAALTTVHKGQDTLLCILRKQRWQDRNLKVNFYGTGPNERVLKKLAVQWGLSNVYFHGYCDRLEKIWSENQALILSSHMEGLPLSLVEAMKYKRMAIAPDVGGINEIIQNHVNGFLAKSSSIDDLESAMESAWDRRAEWEGMGIQAFHSVSKLFDHDPIDQFANELLNPNLYSDLPPLKA
jgi:glycosyltransferase involved in cell wall biosynthesis